MGCFSVVFEPVTMKTSLLITSAAVLLMAEDPTAIWSATTTAGMAQAGAVINIIGAEYRSEQLLQQVIILIGGFGAAVKRHGLRPSRL